MATGPTTSQVSEEKDILKPGAESHNKKKSWLELRNLVSSTRRQQTSLANRVPVEFTFVQKVIDKKKATRLYFLGVPPGNRENTLLYTDLDNLQYTEQDEEQEEGQASANWKPLLVSFRGIFFSSGFSKEEQLLRERKRLGSLGITAYEYHRQSSKFLFQACGSVFTCTDERFENQPLRPKEIISYSITGTRIDCKLCPSDSNLIAFVHEKNIWVTNVAMSEDTQLTFTHTGVPDAAKDPKSAGVASYIIQEEFDRYSGYWWQPTQPATASKKKIHRILYEEVDESNVELMHITHQGFDDHTDYFRYPRAGTCNAKVTLKVVEFEMSEDGRVSNIVWKSLMEELQSIFPWVEYITRLDWTPDGKYVWVQLLNRSQQSTALILIPFSSFVSEDFFLKESLVTNSDPIVYVIYEEHSDIWINVHDCIHFFPQTNPEEISFLWASEATCIRQLYFITAQLQKKEMVPGNLKPSLLKFHQLTHQEAEVLPKKLWVDESRQLVFYKALHDTPLEEHVYVISYVDPQRPIRLTPLGFSVQDMQFSLDFEYLVYNLSNLATPHFCMIARLEYVSQQTLAVTRHDISKLMHLSTALTTMPFQPEPEIFTYQSPSTREMMYGVIIKPVNFDPSKLYPVVHYVYGGPQVQLVSNAFQGMRALRLCPHLGYVVVMLDNRGSSKRGLRFEGYIKHKLGICELEDQVEGLKWIAGQKGYLDLSRVAVHGWSYGGYLSLMALAKRPDVYKVAVAGAPVTNWNSYDTGYTERYMDTPMNNATGYQEGSILNITKNFPDEENRLLLIHGMIDENVHFHHTSQLVDKLVKDCKPYQLLVYPQERHGIRKPDTYEHYETSILSWLQQHL